MSREYLHLIQKFWDSLITDAISEFQMDQRVSISHVGLYNVVLEIDSLSSRRKAEFLKFPWRIQGARKISREIAILSVLSGEKMKYVPRVLDNHLPLDARNWRYTYLVTPAYDCSLRTPIIDEQLQRQMARVLLAVHLDGTRLFSSSHGKFHNHNQKNKGSWLQEWASWLEREVPRGHWLRSSLDIKGFIGLLRKRHLKWVSSPTTLCHGDAALRNWCHGEQKQFLLIDWEDWAFGSLELDVAMLLVESNFDEELLNGALWRYFLDEIFSEGAHWLTRLPFLTVLLLLLIQNWIWSRWYLQAVKEAPPALKGWFPHSQSETRQYMSWIESKIDYVKDRILDHGKVQ